jgi:hypothetical protein
VIAAVLPKLPENGSILSSANSLDLVERGL